MEAIGEAAAEGTLNIVFRERVRQGDADFRAPLARLRRLSPSVAFLVANPQESGLLLRQMRESGLQLPIIGSDNLSAHEVITGAGEAVNGAMFALSSPGQGTRFERFRDRFRERYHAQVSTNSVRAYDALMLVHHVMCTVGAEREAIQKGLESLPSYDGVSGKISFDRHGDIHDPAFDRFVYEGRRYSLVTKR